MPLSRRSTLAGLGMSLALPPAARAQSISPAEAAAVAKEAWIYAYPMMESYNTWRKQAVDSAAPEYVGGFGKFRHYSEPFTAANHDIVTPNNDTPYSWAWLDLRAEPWVLTVPTVPKDRYYVSQWIDLFTYNFAYVGVRATGYEGGSYLFAGPRWKGGTPAGIKQVFHAETDIVGTLTRTALDGPTDVPNVKAIQAGMKLQPLSTFLGQVPPPVAPAISFPPYDKARAETHDFIAYLDFFLQFAEPPHPSEAALRERFATIGIGPGKSWDASKVDAKLLDAIDAGVKQGQEALKQKLAVTFESNGLFGPRDPARNDYLMRAVAANKGLYGNSLEEAWYGGYVGDGAKPSTVHFAKNELPPARFFWSMTLYTLPDRLLYANPIDRYSIGDRTKGLKYGADGSLTVYLSHDPPMGEARANWLPVPAAKYSLVARIYGPSPDAMQGKWKLPPLVAH
jgi:hypothetical protein